MRLSTPRMAPDFDLVVAIFKSSVEEILHYVAKHPRPFTIVDDEAMTVYHHYRVERSIMGMMRRMMWHTPRMVQAARHGFLPHMRGAPLLPPDFLIDEIGIIRTVYYGSDISDHIPMAHIRAFIAAGRLARQPQSTLHSFPSGKQR